MFTPQSRDYLYNFLEIIDKVPYIISDNVFKIAFSNIAVLWKLVQFVSTHFKYGNQRISFFFLLAKNNNETYFDFLKLTVIKTLTP